MRSNLEEALESFSAEFEHEVHFQEYARFRDVLMHTIGTKNLLFSCCAFCLPHVRR